jgi:tetratricopeptide (TPR) repeat protein
MKLPPLLLCALVASASLLAQPSPSPTPEGAPALSRNEAFRKIQAEASGREIVAKASDELDAKRYDAALTLLDSVPGALRDADPALLNARGAALVHLNRIDEAATAFQQSLQIDPTFFPARFNVGEVLFQQEKYAEAASHFRGMINDSGNNPLLKFKLYLCLLLAGNETSADFALRNIRFPLDGPAWYFAQAASQASQGEKSKARDLAVTGRKLHPDEAASYAESLADAKLLP